MPLGQEHIKAEGEGVEPSRLIARLFSKQLPSPIGLPFRIRKAAAAGIEPASERLTTARLYQHRTPQSKSGWQDLNLRSQAPRACAMPSFATPWTSRCGRIRTAVLVLPKHAGFQTTLHTEAKAPSGSRTRTSAMARQQAAATSWALLECAELSKTSRAPGGTRTHVTALRVRNLGR